MIYSCKIISIDNENKKFEAKAINCNNHDDVIALTFSFDDIDEYERPLIELGALFDYFSHDKILFQKQPVYSEKLDVDLNSIFE